MYTDGRAVSERTVDTHVTNLRKMLQPVRADAEGVASVYGAGYKFYIQLMPGNNALPWAMQEVSPRA